MSEELLGNDDCYFVKQLNSKEKQQKIRELKGSGTASETGRCASGNRKLPFQGFRPYLTDPEVTNNLSHSLALGPRKYGARKTNGRP